MKKNRFSFIDDVNYISKLPSIKTIGELKKHIGEVVLMGYFKTQYTSNMCFWMGVLTSENLDEYRNDESVQFKRINTEHFLFTVLNSKGLNIMNRLQSKTLFDYRLSACSDAQDYIFIPDKKFMLYYNLCRAKLSKQIST